MKKTVPITNDIEFNTKIAEISSISLEHDYNSDSEGVSGNFIISGEYKVHEISVNKDTYRHLVPFSINFTNDIKSVDSFTIDDFTYEVIEPNILRIKIEFSIEATEEVFNYENDMREEYNKILEELEKESIEKIPEVKEIPETELITNTDKDYILYKIHIVKEEETLDLICNKYNTTIDYIKEYNEITNIKVGDKLIIPSTDE